MASLRRPADTQIVLDFVVRKGLLQRSFRKSVLLLAIQMRRYTVRKHWHNIESDERNVSQWHICNGVWEGKEVPVSSHSLAVFSMIGTVQLP